MIGALINLIVYLLVVGILIWLVLYVVDNIPLPEPFNRVVRVAVVVLGVLIIVLMILQLMGGVNFDLPTVRS